jgi:hypothetical protein
MQHVWVRGEVQTGYWWGSLRERDHLEDLGVDGKIIFRWFFNEWDGGVDFILAQYRDR